MINYPNQSQYTHNIEIGKILNSFNQIKVFLKFKIKMVKEIKKSTYYQ